MLPMQSFEQLKKIRFYSDTELMNILLIKRLLELINKCKIQLLSSINQSSRFCAFLVEWLGAKTFHFLSDWPCARPFIIANLNQSLNSFFRLILLVKKCRALI